MKNTGMVRTVPFFADYGNVKFCCLYHNDLKNIITVDSGAILICEEVIFVYDKR